MSDGTGSTATRAAKNPQAADDGKRQHWRWETLSSEADYDSLVVDGSEQVKCMACGQRYTFSDRPRIMERDGKLQCDACAAFETIKVYVRCAHDPNEPEKYWMKLSRALYSHGDELGMTMPRLAVIGALCYFNGRNGCYPSQPQIADKARCSETTVKTVIGELLEEGLLDRHRQMSGKKCVRTDYSLEPLWRRCEDLRLGREVAQRDLEGSGADPSSPVEGSGADPSTDADPASKGRFPTPIENQRPIETRTASERTEDAVAADAINCVGEDFALAHQQPPAEPSLVAVPEPAGNDDDEQRCLQCDALITESSTYDLLCSIECLLARANEREAA